MTQNLQNIFSEIESKARAEGAQVELVASNSESFSSNYMKGALNKYSFDNSVSAGIRVLYGRGAGFSTTEKLSRESLMETFKEALQSAKDLDREAPKDKVAQRLYQSNQKPIEMNLWNSDIENMEIQQKLKIAETLESAALGVDPRVQNVPYSSYSDSKGQRWLFSSNGINLTTRAGGVSAFSYALSKSGEDLKTGYASGFFRKPQKLNAESLAVEAARKSLRLLGASQPKSGRYAVVLSNDVASEIIGALNYHLSAKSLDEGTSLLKGKIGEKLFSEKITLTDDPFLTEQTGARPYDSEGAASQKTVTIEKGVLKSFLSNSYLAEKLGIPHTANASRSGGEMGVSSSNTIMALGDSSLEELLNSYNQVILVTSVDALHSGYKETTLDFSLPSYGFLYEKGEIVRPLHQMVMSGNLLQILKDVEKVSRRYENDGSSVLAPDLLIPDISIAGS